VPKPTTTAPDDGSSDESSAVPTYWEPLLGAPAGQLNYVTCGGSSRNAVQFPPDPRHDPPVLPSARWFGLGRAQTADAQREGTFERPLVTPNTGGKYESFTDAADSLMATDSLLGGDEEEDQDVEAHKFWVQLSGEQEERVHGGYKQRWQRPAGQLLISIQLVPEAELCNLEAGKGRSAPNAHPKLPKPVGRLRFTLNPFSMVHQFLGDKLCAYLLCALAVVLILLLMYYMLPVILANGVTAALAAVFSHGGTLVAIGVLVGVPCVAFCCVSKG